MMKNIFLLLLTPSLFSQEEVEWLNKGVDAQNNQQYEEALVCYDNAYK